MPGVAVVAADRRVRDSVASLLKASGQVRVVGEAGDSATALRLVGTGDAEVVVLDRGLANGASPSLLSELRRTLPTARILVIAWNGEGPSTLGDGADAVLDLADQPAALLDAVLSLPPSPTPGVLAD